MQKDLYLYDVVGRSFLTKRRFNFNASKVGFQLSIIARKMVDDAVKPLVTEVILDVKRKRTDRTVAE